MPAALAAADAGISDPIVANDPEVLHLDALGGALLWTHRDEDDQYRALLSIRGGRADTLAPQSSADLDPKLGTDAGGRRVVSYRRCTVTGGCGLYRLDVATGRESAIRTQRPGGCVDDHPVVVGARVVFGRSCSGAGSGLYALRDDRVRRILALRGFTVGAVDADATTVAAVAYRGSDAYVHAVGLGGGGHVTLFHSSAAAAGIDASFPSITVAGGTVTWAYHGDGEHGTDGAIYRARAARGAACGRELRRFSGDAAEGTVAPAELAGIAVDGRSLYYGLVQTGVLRAASPAPAFVVSGSPASATLGAGCDFAG
jgi:hypothetical protein